MYVYLSIYRSIYLSIYIYPYTQAHTHTRTHTHSLRLFVFNLVVGVLSLCGYPCTRITHTNIHVYSLCTIHLFFSSLFFSLCLSLPPLPLSLQIKSGLLVGYCCERMIAAAYAGLEESWIARPGV